MLGRICALLLSLSPLVAMAGGAADQETPGMKAYDAIQALRQQGNKLIDDKGDPDAIRKAIGYFDQAIKMLDQPDIDELGNGNIYLKARRFDVELDLAQAYAALGEKNAAIDHLEAAARFSSFGGIMDTLIKFRPGLAALQSEPRFQRLVQENRALDRIWKHPAIATAYADTLSPGQRVAGLSLFWSEANFAFVYFDHVPDVDWDEKYLEFLPQVLAAQTTHDYYEVMMRFAPLLRDAHTNIYPPEAIAAQFYASPPIETALVDGHVLVLQVASPTVEKLGVHAGDEIAAIDGQPVREYAESHVRPYVSSGTPQDAAARMYGYALLHGDESKAMALTLRDSRGHERVVTVNRSHYGDAHWKEPAFFRDLGRGVVYVNLDQFENDHVDKEFDKAWPRIRAAKALILDVRDNGGGSSRYGEKILAYLTANSIPRTTNKQRSYSPVSRAQGFASITWQGLNSGPAHNERSDPFDGKVVVLIGPKTFSAAEDFVASFQLMHRGTLIGERTGGGTGQPLAFDLPGGGTARICAKRDEYPDGHTFVGVGIAPDIEVRPTVADVRANRDPVLVRAMADVLR